MDWFNDRWKDRWCIDITQELIEIEVAAANLSCAGKLQKDFGAYHAFDIYRIIAMTTEQEWEQAAILNQW